MTFDPSYIAPPGDNPAPVSSTEQPRAITQAPGTPAVITQRRTEAGLVQEVVLQPISASIERPPVREAGKFSLEFLYRDLPIDPRIFSSITADVYMGSVTAANSAAGLAGRYVGGSNPAVVSLVDENLAFVGIVDKVSMSHSDTSSRVTMEGRDLRAFLVDTNLPAIAFTELDLRKPITSVVRQILDLQPWGRSIGVYWFPEEWKVPGDAVQGPPAPYAADNATRVRLGATGKESKGTPRSGDEVKFWDIIVQYCFLCGVLPYFDGEKLVLRRARAYWASESVVRGFIYGRDVRALTIDRSLAGPRYKVVQVVNVDTDSDQRGSSRLVEVTYGGDKVLDSGNPDGKLNKVGQPRGQTVQPQPTNIAPSRNESFNDVLRVPVPGVKNRAQLLEIAKAIYEEQNRFEFSGSLETANLGSYTFPDGAQDILRIRPGDAIRVQIDARLSTANAPAVAPLTDQKRADPAARIAELVRNGYSQQAAQAIVVSEQRGIPELAPVFRVKAARFDFDVTTGIKITVDFNNYVEATRAKAGLTVTTGLPAGSTSQVAPTVLAATRVER
jgi:hypothetical protein